jgi:hypothetical protein
MSEAAYQQASEGTVPRELAFHCTDTSTQTPLRTAFGAGVLALLTGLSSFPAAASSGNVRYQHRTGWLE